MFAAAETKWNPPPPLRVLRLGLPDATVARIWLLRARQLVRKVEPGENGQFGDQCRRPNSEDPGVREMFSQQCFCTALPLRSKVQNWLSNRCWYKPDRVLVNHDCGERTKVIWLLPVPLKTY